MRRQIARRTCKYIPTSPQLQQKPYNYMGHNCCVPIPKSFFHLSQHLYLLSIGRSVQLFAANHR
ncbi:hypothetical protein V6Z11_A13G144800 [Gossypium hirsutum]